MRVGTMTFHRALNCGAVLQAWALVQAVGARGHRCEVIDYRCAYIEHRRGRFLRSGKDAQKVAGGACAPAQAHAAGLAL